MGNGTAFESQNAISLEDYRRLGGPSSGESVGSLVARLEAMQELMVLHVTGGRANEKEYAELRRELLFHPEFTGRLPRVVETCRTAHQLWHELKHFDTYQARREFLWGQFRPVLDALEGLNACPADEVVSEVLTTFDVEHVGGVWQKALGRRAHDPDGAITIAKTLIETVCKHILDDYGVSYSDRDDLPRMYHLAAEQLRLAPSQHTENEFRRILGSCEAVVNSLSALRNWLGDAHGQGRRVVRPAPRHAELAVNLAGTMATFLVATWSARRSELVDE